MLYIFKYLFFAVTLLVFGGALGLETNWHKSNESEVRLISPITKNNFQSQIYIGVEYLLEEGWKTYWQSPGDGGFPQEIKWDNSKNIEDLEINWPSPKKFEILGIQSIGYSDNVIFPIKINLKDPSISTSIILDINYLVCKDICIPGNAHLNLFIPSGLGLFTEHSFILEKTISELPKESLDLNFLDEAGTTAYIDNDYIFFEFLATSKKIFVNPNVYLHTKYGLPVINPTIQLSPDSKKLKATFIFDKKLIEDENIQAQITYTDNNRSFLLKENIILNNKKLKISKNFLSIMLIAFIGGLVLNAMPCVLPILSIKLMSILNNLNDGSSIRKSFLITATGIIFSFVLISLSLILLRYLGYQIGWGIQFQQPIFLMFIILVLLLFSLNLFGIFVISLPNFLNSTRISNSINSHARDFFNGFFATLMATPCSAPFVGTALTFAFTQPSYIMLSIFTSMGIGMSSPYLLISLFPQFIKFFPKPGKWMLYLKYFLGFLLILTLIWILNILLNHFNYYFLFFSFFLLVIVFILNIYLLKKIIIPLVAIIIFFILPQFSFFKINYDKNQFDDWLDFNLVNIENLINDGNVVFIDVTADWCATCQFNKINVLNKSIIKEEFLKFKVIKVRADWTKPSDKISKFLQDNQKYGIPFNILYDKNNLNGVSFSEILSLDEILTKLNKL